MRILVENAAIGATGSALAAFRAKRDLISRGCDLVFIDYAVNDNGEPLEQRQRSREGLVRQLLAEERDVVFVHTYCQDMYASMSRGEVPPSIQGLEEIAEHYAIGTVWMGLAAMREVAAGGMRWHEWLPDGLHPQYRGSFTYGKSVTDFLNRELRTEPSKKQIPFAKNLPARLREKCWDKVSLLAWDKVKTEGPWSLRRWTTNVWMDQVLFTPSPGAKLSFDFNGRGLAFGFDFGKQSAEFRLRIDGGEWKESVRDRPAWCGDNGWFRIYLAGDELGSGTHEVEIEVIHGNRPECTGSDFSLAFIGVME
ncbi:MAG: SGNH/GDSL hydrolase family protein [Spirochaetia bacterium]|nr:SGNH/GDSL hydrolase family protein [Spirochaetia bacterium]